MIRYTEYKIKRLGKGYDTDCYDYESDTNFNYYRIRSDCVNDCYQDKLREICNVDSNLFINNILIRRDYIKNWNERLILACDLGYNLRNLEIKRICEKKCKIECNFIYYSIEIEKKFIKSNNDIVDIRHGEYPDIFVEYIPKMNLIDFICNFGGLLGMWLGLSLLGILRDILEFITKIDHRKYLIILRNVFKRIKIHKIFHFN